MQKEKVIGFIKDPTVSSCILAVLSLSQKEFLREIKSTKELKEYKQIRIRCINSTSGKESTRYLYKPMQFLSPEEFIKMYSTKGTNNKFQKIFLKEYTDYISENENN